MSFSKELRDKLLRLVAGNDFRPRGLVDLQEYFRHNPEITFELTKKDGGFIAHSKNFRYGSIVTVAKSLETLDHSVRDAILTTFEIPSSYEEEAGIRRRGVAKSSRKYVLA